MNTETQDWIIDRVGAQNWAEVVAEYRGKSANAIENELDRMFPSDDNAELATQIAQQVRWA